LKWHNPPTLTVLTDPTVWRTDRQTDGRATAYSALCICCCMLKRSWTYASSQSCYTRLWLC